MCSFLSGCGSGTPSISKLTTGQNSPSPLGAMASLMPGAGIVEAVSDVRNGDFGSAAFNVATEVPIAKIGKLAKLAKGADNGASSARSGQQLQKQLASESQMADLANGGGTVISQPAKSADRIAAQTGIDPQDVQKVTSDAFKASDGTHIETHAFRNAQTNELIEPKTIIDP